MFKRYLVLILLIAMLGTPAIGCQPPGPVVGGTLVHPLIGVPNVFNPILSSDAASSVIEARIFEGLLRYDKNMKLIGLLAIDWDISDDGLEWTFYLKEGVRWHDGKPFTAQDVKFTFETVAFNPDYPGPLQGRFSLLERVDIIDDLTVKFSLKKPFGPFLNNIGLPIIPRHIYDPALYQGDNYSSVAQMMQHPNNWAPIGTGPWVYGEWKPGEYILIERNQNYHDGNRPYIDKIEYRFFPDINAAVAALQGMEIDYLAGLPDGVLETLEQELADTHNFYSYPDLSYEYLGFNFREDAFGPDKVNPWLDLKVRQALAHAIDRQELVDKILKGRGTVTASSVPQESWAYAGEGLIVYNYNPAKAAYLLDQAGWSLANDGFRYKDGQKFEITLTTNQGNSRRETVGRLVQAHLAQVGIEVRLNLVEWEDFFTNHLYTGDYEMIAFGWAMGADPDVYSLFHSSQVENGLNFGSYNNEHVDSLLIIGRNTVLYEARKQIYAQLQVELSRDLPYLFLFSRDLTAAAKKTIGGIVPSPLGLVNMADWHIDTD